MSSAGSKKVGVHPLAIANICDHYTRVRVGGSKLATSAPVIGLLFGVQNGLAIEVMDASEAVYEALGDGGIHDVVLNITEIRRRIKVLTAVFTTYEMLGWYALCENVLPLHYEIHQTMLQLNESPLFLLMNPNPMPSLKQLPIRLSESQVHIDNESPISVFVDLPFTMVTSPMEQISIDGLTVVTPSDGISSTELQNNAISTAIVTIQEKVDLLIQTLEKMKSSLLPVDHSILRASAKICDQLKGRNNDGADTMNDVLDCMMISYLGMSTKTSNDLLNFAEYNHIINSDDRR